jgi:uncharacterized repeat protein (TIGR03803 family)
MTGRAVVYCAIDPQTNTEEVEYSFCSQKNCSDGANPFANLIEADGKLFGTTSAGGAASSGTVFEFDPGTGVEKVIHSFGSGNDGVSPYAGLIYANGDLYGTTVLGGANSWGTVFSIELKSGAESVLYAFCSKYVNNLCLDGAGPNGSLVYIGDVLYGVTYSGGSYDGEFGSGTVFSLKP